MILRFLRRVLSKAARPQAPVAAPAALTPFPTDVSEEDETVERLDVKKIKHEINTMAAAIREYKLGFKQAQRNKEDIFEANISPSEATVARAGEWFQKRYLNARGKQVQWRWWQVEHDYTRLCALRAHMRGKLHFHPNTKQATADDLGISCPVTLEAQAEWVEDVAEDYELPEDEVRAAG